MRLTRYILLVTAIFFTVISCKKEFDISGKWILEKEELMVNGKVINKNLNTDKSIDFFSNGTGFDQEGSFDWELSGNILTITDKGISYEYTVTPKGKKKIILEDRSFSLVPDKEDVIVLTLIREKE